MVSTFIKEIALDEAKVLVLVVLSSILHEAGHYLAAFLLGLQPEFILTPYFLAVQVFGGTLQQHLIITYAAILTHFLIILLAIFYILMKEEDVISEKRTRNILYITIIINLFMAAVELLESFE